MLLIFRQFLNAEQYRVVANERIPNVVTNSRNYYNFLPAININKRSRNTTISFTLNTISSEISMEELRTGIDATNPLDLRVGNPSLSQTLNYIANALYSYTDVKRAASYSLSLSGRVVSDFKTDRTTLFTKDTYLPQYDYTALRGAQMAETVNAGGSYGWSVGVDYSKRLPVKWTLKASLSYAFDRTPYYFDINLLHSVSHSGKLILSAISGFSTKVSIGINSTTDYGRYTTMNSVNGYFSQTLNLSLKSVILRKYTFDINSSYFHYSNNSFANKTTNDIMTNVEIGYKFGKKQKMEASVGVIDIFNRVNTIRTILSNEYMKTTSNALLGRYAFARVIYKF